MQLTYTTTGQSQGAGPPQAARRGDGDGRRVVPPAAARGPGGPRRRATTCGRRGSSGDVARRFKLGWAPDDWDALARQSGIDAELLRDDRAGVHEPAQPHAGRVPGPGAVPDLLRHRRGGGHRRPDPARVRRPGEVQELAGDADLRQVQDAVRAELGEGRHRRRRPGGGVRGLHRRDRVPPRRRAAGRGDVRHGVHRGPRAAAQALRQPGRAGVRRRRRRPGRGRAVLRVGAEVPGAGVGGPAARRARTRASWPSAIPRRWRRRSPSAMPFLGLPAASGCWTVSRRARPRTGRAWPSGRWRSSTSTPTRTSASCTPARSPPRSACRSPTSCASPTSGARRPTRHRRAGRGGPRVRENAEFVAVAAARPGLGVDRRRGWSRSCSPTRPTAARSSPSAAADGDLDGGHRVGRPRGPRGARAGRRRRPRRRRRGRGPQPDRRGRAAAAGAAHRRSAIPSLIRDDAEARLHLEELGDADRGRGGRGVVARLAPSPDGGTRQRGNLTIAQRRP